MKIFNLVSNIVLIVAFVLVWVLHPKYAEGNHAMGAEEGSGSQRLAVAYVNIDSVLVNYEKAKDLNEELMAQQEDARTDLTSKARKLEADMVNFQRKVENNGFLNRERAQSEQQRLVGEQQKLEELQQRMSNELGLKQQDLNDQLMTSITEYIERYNKDAQFEMIFTQTGGIGTILHAKPVYNITAKVLDALNKEYEAK